MSSRVGGSERTRRAPVKQALDHRDELPEVFLLTTLRAFPAKIRSLARAVNEDVTDRTQAVTSKLSDGTNRGENTRGRHAACEFSTSQRVMTSAEKGS